MQSLPSRLERISLQLALLPKAEDADEIDLLYVLDAVAGITRVSSRFVISAWEKFKGVSWTLYWIYKERRVSQ